mmetsp:Transcript_21482/g.39011  ORF Transcript_21482/g.39011 Transcript_21482/m.39011 type:complete len:234 (-) Transcript_21482:851-1552(-)
MHHRIAKQHQVHGWVVLIVLLQSIVQKLAEVFVTIDLVVSAPTIHLSNALGKWCEDQRLGVLLLEILLEIELCKHLLRELPCQRTVLLQICHRHKPISVNSLTLVNPEQDDLLWITELQWLGLQETCKHSTHVADVELVMEIACCLTERAHHHAMKAQGCFVHSTNSLLHHGLERQALEMAPHESLVDSVQCSLLGEGHGAGPEVPLQPRVYNEGACSGVHAAKVLRVSNVLD